MRPGEIQVAPLCFRVCLAPFLSASREGISPKGVLPGPPGLAQSCQEGFHRPRPGRRSRKGGGAGPQVWKRLDLVA